MKTAIAVALVLGSPAALADTTTLAMNHWQCLGVAILAWIIVDLLLARPIKRIIKWWREE